MPISDKINFQTPQQDRNIELKQHEAQQRKHKEQVTVPRQRHVSLQTHSLQQELASETTINRASIPVFCSHEGLTLEQKLILETSGTKQKWTYRELDETRVSTTSAVYTNSVENALRIIEEYGYCVFQPSNIDTSQFQHLTEEEQIDRIVALVTEHDLLAKHQIDITENTLRQYIKMSIGNRHFGLFWGSVVTHEARNNRAIIEQMLQPLFATYYRTDDLLSSQDMTTMNDHTYNSQPHFHVDNQLTQYSASKGSPIEGIQAQTCVGEWSPQNVSSLGFIVDSDFKAIEAPNRIMHASRYGRKFEHFTFNDKDIEHALPANTDRCILTFHLNVGETLIWKESTIHGTVAALREPQLKGKMSSDRRSCDIRKMMCLNMNPVFDINREVYAAALAKGYSTCHAVSSNFKKDGSFKRREPPFHPTKETVPLIQKLRVLEDEVSQITAAL